MSKMMMKRLPPNHVEPPLPLSTKEASTRQTVQRVSKWDKNSADALKWTLKASRLKRMAEKAKHDRKSPKPNRRPRA